MELHELKAYICERADRLDMQLIRIEETLEGHGRELSDHAARIKSVESCASKGHPSEKGQKGQSQTGDSAPFLTKHDVKVLGSIVGGLVLLIELLHRAADFFWHLHGS